MKINSKKIGVIVIIEIIIIGIFLFNIFHTSLPDVWEMHIGDVIEATILTLVSYFLVFKDNEDNRKKDSLIRLINKIQNMLSEFNDFKTDSDASIKIARANIVCISNYIDILKKTIPDNKNIGIVVQEKETLMVLILDHSNNRSYLEESRPDILKHTSNINMNLEQIIFDIA